MSDTFQVDDLVVGPCMVRSWRAEISDLYAKIARYENAKLPEEPRTYSYLDIGGLPHGTRLIPTVNYDILRTYAAAQTVLAEEAKKALSDARQGSHMEYEDHNRTKQRCAEAETLLRDALPVLEAVRTAFELDARLWPASDKKIKPLLAAIRALLSGGKE